MSKAKLLLSEIYDINHDYNFIKKIGDYYIGKLKLEDEIGIVDIELPLKNIDPDSETVIIPLYFTYEDDIVSLKVDIKKYYTADTGELKDLDKIDKNKIVDYLNDNKPKMENDLEKFIEDTFKEKSKGLLMAIELTDVVERLVSTLESQTGTSGTSVYKKFPKIRDAYYPTVKQLELELNLSGNLGTSGAAQPLPHTLASFVWYQPVCIQTPITQPYTYPVLRPISSGCLIEAFVEVGSAALGGSIVFDLYKNNTQIAEITLGAGITNAYVPITGSLSLREFTRDDFFAYKITESTTLKAVGLTVYLRFFQYPYIMADHQSPLPEPV